MEKKKHFPREAENCVFFLSYLVPKSITSAICTLVRKMYYYTYYRYLNEKVIQVFKKEYLLLSAVDVI